MWLKKKVLMLCHDILMLPQSFQITRWNELVKLHIENLFSVLIVKAFGNISTFWASEKFTYIEIFNSVSCFFSNVSRVLQLQLIDYCIAFQAASSAM